MEFTLNYFTYINIAIIIYYLFMILKGYKTGFLMQVANLLGTLVSVYIAYYFSSILSKYINLWPRQINMENYEILNTIFYEKLNGLAWFVVLFILCRILFFILKPTLKFIQNFPLVKQINSILGLVAGFIIGTFWILLLCIILNTPLVSNGLEIIDNTFLGLIQDTSSSLISDYNDLILENKNITNTIRNLDNLNETNKTWLEKFLEENNLKGVDIEDVLENLNE